MKLANLVTLVAWGALVAVWMRRDPRIRRVFLTTALVAAAAAFAVGRFVAGRVPLDWIVPLQEGRSERAIFQLYGLTTHAGTNWRAVLELVGCDGSIRDIVRMNVVLATLNVTMLAALLATIVGRPAVVALASVAFALNANTLNATLSELPSALLSTYFLLAVVPVALFETLPSPRRGALAIACVVNVSCWTLLAAATRVEWFAMGLPAVLTMAARVARSDDGWRAWFGSWVGGTRRRRQVTVAVAVAVGVTLVEHSNALKRFVTGREATWIVTSIHTWIPTRSGLPDVLSGFLPMPVAFALFVCLLVSFRHFARVGLLPLAIIGLWGLFESASHGNPYERFRYVSMLTVPIFVAAAVGWSTVARWLDARQTWRRYGDWVAAAACFGSLLPGVPGRSALSLRPEFAGVAEHGPVLDRNLQRSVRYVVGLAGRYPDCTFIARVSSAPHDRSRSPLDQWVFFGASRARPLTVPTGDDTVANAVEREAPHASCLLYYRSMDCNLREAAGRCEEDQRGMRPVERLDLESRPYSDPEEYGQLRARISLGVWEFRPGRHAAMPREPRQRPENSGQGSRERVLRSMDVL